MEGWMNVYYTEKEQLFTESLNATDFSEENEFNILIHTILIILGSK